MPVSTLLHSGPLSESVSDAIKRIESERIVERINQRDYTVWHPSPDEISNRLGWLDCPQPCPTILSPLSKSCRQREETACAARFCWAWADQV